MAEKKRYWVYAHDPEGNLVMDIGEWDTFVEAYGAVNGGMEHAVRINVQETATFRIVDNQLDSTTIWMAGPVKVECSHGSVFRGETCSRCGQVVE